MTAYSQNLTATRLIIRKLIKRQKSKEELDGVFLVCGEEGSGKSNFMLNCLDLWEQETNLNLDISHVAVDLRHLIYSMAFKKKSFHILDEGDELNNLNQWDDMVKKTKRVFVVSRADAQIVLLSYPNPLKMLGYFKEDRAKGIFFCYKRKYVLFFTREAFRDIREKVAKSGVKGIDDFVKAYKDKATLLDTVPLYQGHLREEYIKRKRKNIDNVFDEVINDLKKKEKTFSLNKVAQLLKVSRPKLNEILAGGIVDVQWNALHTKARLTEQDIDKLKQHIDKSVSEFTNFNRKESTLI